VRIPVCEYSFFEGFSLAYMFCVLFDGYLWSTSFQYVFLLFTCLNAFPKLLRCYFTFI
jgi:hypothetical protein